MKYHLTFCGFFVLTLWLVFMLLFPRHEKRVFKVPMEYTVEWKGQDGKIKCIQKSIIRPENRIPPPGCVVGHVDSQEVRR